MTDSTPDRKPRHDAFDGKRRRDFLEALGKTGCLRDAARRAGVSHQTVYNHQARDPQFARQCELALQMASTDIELHAWERGVVGVEEPIVRGGQIIGTRLKRSDAILRLLLQGAKRNKYGPNPGFTRRRLHKLERAKIEREVRDEHRAKHYSTPEETDAALRILLDKFAARTEKEQLAKGWSKDGRTMIPPGWVRVAAPEAETGAPVVPEWRDKPLHQIWTEQKSDSV